MVTVQYLEEVIEARSQWCVGDAILCILGGLATSIRNNRSVESAGDKNGVDRRKHWFTSR